MPSTSPPERLLTPKQVADLLNVSAAWVRDHASRRRPQLLVVRLGSERKAILRFCRRDIERFIEAHLR